LVLFVSICFTSCVNRIDIPEDEPAKLYIKLEILKNETEVTAEFKTTNNLNGTYPISTPNSAEIIIRELQPADFDNVKKVVLNYDEEQEKYISINDFNKTFLIQGKKYSLEASVENSNLPAISSITVVPHEIEITDYELLGEEEVVDKDGNIFWQGTLGLTFLPSNSIADNYGHLQIYGVETNLGVDLQGDTIHIMEQEERFFDLVDVNDGYGAVTDIIHREGFFIDMSDLSDNYLEVVIRSNFPITKETQVTDFLDTRFTSLSKEHYDYHISIHNIKSNQGNIFEENALYRSNIEDGLGLFSSCVEMTQTLELRK